MDRRQLLPPLAASVPITIFSLAAVAIPLAAAESLRLSPIALGTWLLALYGVPGVLSIVLTLVYRQPLFVAWHTSLVVFLATLGDQASLAELRGATLVGGVTVAALGVTGLGRAVGRLVPTPVVFGVVAGSVLPFVVRAFDALGQERWLVGPALLAWLASRRWLGARVPPVLPALLVGVVAATLAGRLARLPGGWALPALDPAWPQFSLGTIATVVPVFVALTVFHSNLTATTYLRSEGYAPPVRGIDAATGLGSVLAAFFGPTPICMGALVTPLTAGPEAGERPVRIWSVFASGAAFAVIGLLGGIAAGLPQVIPLALLLAVAGFALVGVLQQALTEVTRGPLRLAPLLAFVVTGSHLTLWQLGAPFWALVLGTGVAVVLEGGGPPGRQSTSRR